MNEGPLDLRTQTRTHPIQWNALPSHLDALQAPRRAAPTPAKWCQRQLARRGARRRRRPAVAAPWLACPAHGSTWSTSTVRAWAGSRAAMACGGTPTGAPTDGGTQERLRRRPAVGRPPRRCIRQVRSWMGRWRWKSDGARTASINCFFFSVRTEGVLLHRLDFFSLTAGESHECKMLKKNTSRLFQEMAFPPSRTYFVRLSRKWLILLENEDAALCNKRVARFFLLVAF